MVQVSAVKEGGTNLGGRLVTYKSECLLFLEVFLRSGGGQKEMTTFFFFLIPDPPQHCNTVVAFKNMHGLFSSDYWLIW